MANIPAEPSPFAHEMRSLWIVPADSWLVGVDADAIQLRILAHYINDPKFTEALINGRKENGTDIHTLNKIALGPICKSRADAKTFIYAWLLGAGDAKIATILGCSLRDAKEAKRNFLEAYPGLKRLKEVVIPRDAEKGYFVGLDGRAVLCNSEHLMLAGYLQNGESIIMKKANLLWRKRLEEYWDGWFELPYKQVNFVHDEWQTEVQGDYELAKQIAEIQAQAITDVGIELNLNCPLKGSFITENHDGEIVLTIGRNWAETH
jgi:DNA polymerase-1